MPFFNSLESLENRQMVLVRPQLSWKEQKSSRQFMAHHKRRSVAGKRKLPQVDPLRDHFDLFWGNLAIVG